MHHRIKNFEKVRADGHVISETVTVDDLLSRGLGIRHVVSLRWIYEGVVVQHVARSAVVGMVVPGDHFVAAVTFEHPSGVNERLVVLGPNGNEHATIQDHVCFMGVDKPGRWNWFEPAMSPRNDVFGAVLSTKHDGDFLCDIDARTAEVLAVRRTR
jgi:hypothetical protein